jgi:hypothetical protein
VDPLTGTVARERLWPEERDWGPFVGPAGLYFHGRGRLRLVGRSGLEDLATRDLSEDPDWLAPFKDEGVALLPTEQSLHVFVPHRVYPGTAGKEVPVLSWYRLSPDLGEPATPRPWRLRLPRPPEAVFLEERVEVSVFALPGRPDQALVAVQMGWSRYEVLVLDLRHPKILRRVDVSPGDELTDSGYLRTRPVVTEVGGRPRVAWVDLWGVLKVVELSDTRRDRGRGP